MKRIAMDESFKTYRDVIRYEFFFRHHKNPAYSMSAFARDLGIAPSRLSEIFSGKQGLSPERARDVGAKIGYKAKKLTWFCNLVESETARSPKMKAAAKAKLEEVRNGVMSEAIQTRLPFDLRWEHKAVRRMALMAEFQESAEWISQKLGTSTEIIRRVLNDLIELGLLRRNEEGKLELEKNVHFPSTSHNRNQILRMFRSIMVKALQSSAMPNERRHHGLHFFTLDKELIPELKAIIQEFEDKIDNLTYKSKRHDELYALLDIAFPLIK